MCIILITTLIIIMSQLFAYITLHIHIADIYSILHKHTRYTSHIVAIIIFYIYHRINHIDIDISNIIFYIIYIYILLSYIISLSYNIIIM